MTKEIKRFIKRETRKRRASLWGDYIVFSPVLLTKVFGDGLQIIYFGSIDQRPRWWIVRVDSKTVLDADVFDYEEILSAIEEEFGRVPYEGDITYKQFREIKKSGKLLFDWNTYSEYKEACKYPAITWGGGHWGTIKNFGVKTSLKN